MHLIYKVPGLKNGQYIFLVPNVKLKVVVLKLRGQIDHHSIKPPSDPSKYHHSMNQWIHPLQFFERFQFLFLEILKNIKRKERNKASTKYRTLFASLALAGSENVGVAV